MNTVLTKLSILINVEINYCNSFTAYNDYYNKGVKTFNLKSYPVHKTHVDILFLLL